MNDSYGWDKIVHNDYIFWFKGYVLDGSFNSVAQSLSIFLLDLKNSDKTLIEFLSCIRGHYSLIIHNDDAMISVVDKVGTIPLFYSEKKKILTVSNSATAIKDNLSLNESNFDSSSILEISMSGYTIGNKTLYHDMKQLTAGECIFSYNNCFKKQYYHTYSPWKVDIRSRASLKNELTDVLLDIMNKLALSVKGKSVIVPLSAGYDSRLIVSGLKEVGVEDVLCISYGKENSFEVLAAKDIAKKLGYSFKHVDYGSDYIRSYYNSNKYNKFRNFFNRYNSIEFTQDMSAISLMHANSELDSNTIIINGMSGDYISGGHISHKFHNPNILELDKGDLFDVVMEEYVKKQYGLWGGMISNNKNEIIGNMFDFLGSRIPDFHKVDNIYAIFEFLEFYGRQSKFVVKGQEVYDYHGCGWRLPLWDPVFIDFWQGVSLDNKYAQRLYKEVLVGNNWGGVWGNIPINEKTIQPKWIRPIRFFSKALFSPLGKKYWHQFERNALLYWMDGSFESSLYPYKRFLLDNRKHRNMLSFRTEDYIKKHTNINLNSLM
jgi:asparagine synthase (glutamine-hydrolysing)